MKYLSVCSGIEAASVAWHPLGWEPVAFSEIEKFPSAVLAHHYPAVPNLGDMTRFEEWPAELLADADILVGGSPCQAFSVAGKRESLADARGNLTLVYTKLLEAIDEQRSRAGRPPAICVWENVPGVLSTKDNAFGCFLAGLVGEEVPLQAPRGKWEDAGVVVGPERLAAWRILDAQFFGVAQRRRRVFLISVSLRHPRAWACAAALLPLIESVQRNPAPSREARQGAAASVGSGPDGGRIAGAVTRKGSKGSGGPAGDECYNMVAQVFAIQGTLIGRGDNAGPQGSGVGERGPMFTLTKTDVHAVAQPVATTMQVRRLTPVECERLQGFPDGYTNIPWRKKPEAPDGPRYKALGNSMAVPCMAWIGQRIAEVDRGD